VFREASWIAAARRAFTFLVANMTRDGRLLHSYRLGSARHDATLDDYAAMTGAALALYEATGEGVYLAKAEDWIGVLDTRFRDAQAGGYFFTADDAEALIVRTKTANDNATPSGNGLLVDALARLWMLTGDDAYRERAQSTVAAFAGEVERNFFPLATLLNANEFLERATHVVIVGEPDDPAQIALADIAWGTAAPNRLVQLVTPSATLPASHPASGKGMVDGKPAAYVCTRQACSLPVTDADGLALLMRS
jgi:uncharacterized protein YyaL (SSP411 family)